MEDLASLTTHLPKDLTLWQILQLKKRQHTGLMLPKLIPNQYSKGGEETISQT
jgi:hypothetical protein